ncbi:MAG: PA14 domain-containing protein [Planctomycetota bacterium]|jgi:hypothetical protein
MKRTVWLATLVLVAASAAADEPASSKPLECMKHYKMKEFPVVAWCFHNYEGTDYNEQYAKDVAAANFNAVLETGYMMEAYQKAGVNVILNILVDDTLTERDVWGTKRTHPTEKGLDLHEAHAKYGKNPALVGYHVGSMYGSHPLPPRTAERVKAVEDLEAGLFPWVSHCWDVDGHGKAGITIMTIQCFRRTKHLGFGYDNKGWPHEKRNSYCAVLEDGRRIANQADFAFWPMFPAATASKGQGEVVGSLHGASEIRFQVLAPIAYGAQGVVYFGYSTTRDVWKPHGATYLTAKDVNELVTKVIGPRVLGHRSIGVYCSRPDAPAKLRARPPKGALIPGEGKLIEKMDEGVLAGVLVKEEDFKSGAKMPHYVMLIDARTAPLQYEKALQERTLKVTFGPQVKAVEIFGAKGEPATTRCGREVSLKLRGGDGRLIMLELATEAEAAEAMFGPAGGKAYLELKQLMAELRRMVSEGKTNAASFEQAYATVRGSLDSVLKAAADPGGPARLPQQQRQARAQQAQQQLEAIRDDALKPRFSPPGPTFVEKSRLTITTKVKGAPIRYTTDGSDPVGGKVYSEPVRLAEGMTVKAVAFSGGQGGPTAEMTFQKIEAAEPARVTGLEAGLAYRYFEGAFKQIPANLPQMSPAKAGAVERFDITVAGRKDEFVLEFTGYIDAPEDGAYTFFLTSDDGSKLYIGEKLVVDNDGRHPPQERSGEIGLRKGKHPIRVEFLEYTGGELLRVEWQPPRFGRREIPAGALFHKP